MTNPEYYFDESNPGDYELFGIRYLILPAGRPPRCGASGDAPGRTRCGQRTDWLRPRRTIVGALAANRTDMGLRSRPLLSSGLPSTVTTSMSHSTIPVRRRAAPAAPGGPARGARDLRER